MKTLVTAMALAAEKWDYPTSKSWVNCTPAVRDGVVYVSARPTARASWRSTRRRGGSSSTSRRRRIFSSAAIAGSLVYFGNHAGSLYAVDAKTGDAAWQFKTDAATLPSSITARSTSGAWTGTCTP